MPAAVIIFTKNFIYMSIFIVLLHGDGPKIDKDSKYVKNNYICTI